MRTMVQAMILPLVVWRKPGITPIFGITQKVLPMQFASVTGDASSALFASPLVVYSPPLISTTRWVTSRSLPARKDMTSPTEILLRGTFSLTKHRLCTGMAGSMEPVFTTYGLILAIKRIVSATAVSMIRVEIIEAADLVILLRRELFFCAGFERCVHVLSAFISEKYNRPICGGGGSKICVSARRLKQIIMYAFAFIIS